MNTPTKISITKSLREKAKLANEEVKRLKAKIEQLPETEGFVLESALQKDLSEVLTSSDDTLSSFPEGSFYRLFVTVLVKRDHFTVKLIFR